MSDEKREGLLEGLGPRSLVPTLAAGVDLLRMPLDPRQAFIVSRVDGFTSLGQICKMVPYPESTTVNTLRALHAQGVIEIPGIARPGPRLALSSEAPPRPVAPPSTSRHPVIAAPPPPRPAATPPPGPAATAPKGPTSGLFAIVDGKSPPAEAARATTPVPAKAAAAPSAAPNDGIDLSAEQRRRIDDVHRWAAKGDVEALFGVPAGSDRKAYRKAYFRLAKEFHPDRYFGKELGPYRARLELIFATINDQFHKLADE